MATYGPTYWWSHWEVIEQVSLEIIFILTFLRQDDLGSAITIAKLLIYLLIRKKGPELVTI